MVGIEACSQFRKSEEKPSLEVRLRVHKITHSNELVMLHVGFSMKFLHRDLVLSCDSEPRRQPDLRKPILLRLDHRYDVLF